MKITVEFGGDPVSTNMATSRELVPGEPLPMVGDIVEFQGQVLRVIDRDFRYTGVSLSSIYIELGLPE